MQGGRRFDCCLERSEVGLSRLGTWVDQVSTALVLAPVADYALRLCLEEAVANIVMHGGPADGAAWVAVGLSADSTTLQVTIEDTCPAFDPASGRTPQPAQDRPGGHGIRLMRQYASDVSYRRMDGTNQLILVIART
ncbi:MAG: ATP-binding protein [Acetobacteraceae bacterium]|nr:ATP-binding protein [Acetobacteraceae bacterium]